MAGQIVTDYNAIRAKMGVTVNDLPDADLDSVALIPVAEALIMNLVTTWAAIMSGSGSDKIFLQAGAVCIAGALACTAKLKMQRSQSFKLVDYQESETKVNFDTMREALLLEGRGYLYMISSIMTKPVHTNAFTATGPTSSGLNWPTIIDQWFARIHPHIITWLSDDGQKLYPWENNP